MSDRPAETEYSALQALLQIRTNAEGNGESGEGLRTSENGSQKANMNSDAKIANLFRIGASTATILQQAQLTYSPTQLAAMRAAVSLQHSTSGLNHGGLLHGVSRQNATFSRPLLGAMVRDPALMAAAVASAPKSPPLDLPRSRVLSPRRQNTGLELPPCSIGAAGLSLDFDSGSSAKSEAQEAAEIKIRKGEVEAALRSKPQRGRKRENLNAEERLELTRTRNREHAKSTRIRKKARYQELLDAEQKLLELQCTEGLQFRRREAVLGFLDARASMLQITVDNTMKPSKKISSDSQNTTTEIRQSTENRSLSFDSLETPVNDAIFEGESKPKACRKVQDSEKSLRDFLEDARSFRFETCLGGIHMGDANAMIRFDEIVARWLEHILGPASCRIVCRVHGSVGGIAMNQDGTGFARVEHVAATYPGHDQTSNEAPSSKDEERILLSSLVSFEFAKGSHLINAVSWGVLKDGMGMSGLGSANSSKSDATAKESLESQTVYPSVVSFDEAHREKSRGTFAFAGQPRQQDPVDQMDNQLGNPGMDISI